MTKSASARRTTPDFGLVVRFVLAARQAGATDEFYRILIDDEKFLGKVVKMVSRPGSTDAPPRTGKPVGSFAILGALLQMRRAELGVSQVVLAERFGMKQQTLCLLERDERRPQEKYFPKIAKFLGITIEDVRGLIER